MASEATLDRFGRVVIPKQTRDHFRLEPGSALTVDEREDGILLRPARTEAPLRVKGAVLVFTGELASDTSKAIAHQREARLRGLMPRKRR